MLLCCRMNRAALVPPSGPNTLCDSLHPATWVFPEDSTSQKERSIADGINSLGSKRAEFSELCIKGPEDGKPLSPKFSQESKHRHTLAYSFRAWFRTNLDSLEFPPTTPASALRKLLSPERHCPSPSNHLQIMG
jgi:hypothetical protein